MLFRPLLIVCCISYLLCYTWEDYKKDFNKQYANSTMDALHEAAFTASMEYIKQQNSMNLDYKLAPTKWSDVLSQDISRKSLVI